MPFSCIFSIFLSAHSVTSLVADARHLSPSFATSAAAGLTLTAARHVLLLEPFLRAGEEEQALNRCHRIGQTREVETRVYYVKGSVEERVRHLLDHYLPALPPRFFPSSLFPFSVTFCSVLFCLSVCLCVCVSVCLCNFFPP